MTGAPRLSSSGMSRFTFSESSDLLGKGTYASVYSARDTEGSLGKVALKKIDFDPNVEGCPLLLLREIGLAGKLKHPNLVPILAVEYSPSDGRALIAFELMQSDLRQFLNRTGPLRGRDLCEASLQLASGLEFLHMHGVMHRDLKPQNVLVKTKTSSGGGLVLKIGDFGLARTFGPVLSCKYTKEVMTLWYRCPELLLGGSLYGPKGDCWSLGCLLAEMGSGTAIFSGESEVSVMFKIFKTLGTPDDSVWNRVSELVNFSNKFPKWRVSNEQRRETFANLLEDPLKTPRDRMRYSLRSLGSSSPTTKNGSMNKAIVSVIDGLFEYVPSVRLSAEGAREALQLALKTD
jgi:serine/threonine protein kinase